MQPKNKNDGVQFSRRYWAYLLAKRCFGNESGSKVFPIGEGQEVSFKKNEEKCAYCLTSTCHKGVGNDGMTLLELTSKASDAQRIYDAKGIAKTLKGLGGGQGAKTGLYAIPVLTPDRKEKRQNGRRFKEDGEPSFTLTSQDQHGVYDGVDIRRLTPTECCRLQGFPDDWVDGLSDSQKYKCLGNAVTVNVIAEIIRRLMKTRNHAN